MSNPLTFVSDLRILTVEVYDLSYQDCENRPNIFLRVLSRNTNIPHHQVQVVNEIERIIAHTPLLSVTRTHYPEISTLQIYLYIIFREHTLAYWFLLLSFNKWNLPVIFSICICPAWCVSRDIFSVNL